jgi:hypothetical protein
VIETRIFRRTGRTSILIDFDTWPDLCRQRLLDFVLDSRKAKADTGLDRWTVNQTDYKTVNVPIRGKLCQLILLRGTVLTDDFNSP